MLGDLAAESPWISRRVLGRWPPSRGGSAAEAWGDGGGIGNGKAGLGKDTLGALGGAGGAAPSSPGRVQGTLHPRARPADAPPGTPQRAGHLGWLGLLGQPGRLRTKRMS